MYDDDDELNEILKKVTTVGPGDDGGDDCDFGNCNPIAQMCNESLRPKGKFEQWTTSDDKNYMPAARTISKLPSGCYEIMSDPNIGIYFQHIPVRTEGLLKFPQTNSEKVIKEIQKFWEREKYFRKYGLTYKRGIVLWGPAGSGKSCTLQIIMADVVGRGGVVLKFTQPKLFIEGVRILRQIQPNIPVVVLMEDIDALIETFNESDILNILDGVDQIENTVFLATTNYPEKLGPRIINRPSRFDKRFKIGHPNDESRRMYIEHITKDCEEKIDMDKWIKDTEGFSLAHLKELFVAVMILGDDYASSIKSLHSMKEIVQSEDDRGPIGFHRGASED